MELLAQDKIFLKSGDTLSVIIAQHDDQSVSYTSYDDPEFNTQSLSTDQITKIQLNNGKVINFKKPSKYPGYYVGIYFGEGVPVGDFAHAEANDERSGFAESKPFLSFEGRMRVFRFIGAQADVSVGTFGVDSGPYFEYENKTDTSGNIQSISGKLSDYRYGTFSIGPDLGFNLGKKFKVFFPVQLSLISISNKGDDQINYTDINNITTTIYRSSRGTGAGIAIGLKLDYLLGKHFGLGISAKAQDYEVAMKVQERYVGGTNIDYQWNQSVSFFYAGLNLHYHF
ncbi:MAG: hypothetical protein JWM14_1556 [Chitinophagaceae bacterium]|nr:hypothetical protein [Chitinophagaceae bacterium]